MTDHLAAEHNRLQSVGIRLRGTLVGLTLLSSLGLIPGSAWALAYVIAPGATLDFTAAPSTALTGSFELVPWGVCSNPCKPDAYSMHDVALAAGGRRDVFQRDHRADLRGLCVEFSSLRDSTGWKRDDR